MVASQNIARAEGSAWIDSDHLAHGAFSDPLTITLLEAANAKTAPIIEALRQPPTGPPPSGHIPFTDDAKKTLEQALRATLALGHDGITGAHVFLGALDGKPDGVVAQALAAQGIGRSQLHHAATGLPIIRGTDDTAEVLQALADSPQNTPEKRRELEIQLISHLLADGRIRDARQLADRLLAEGDDAEVHHYLTAIGEASGDVNLVLKHAAAIIEMDDSANLHHGSLALALALNDRGAEAIPHITKALEAEGLHHHTALLEAAEIALVAGDTDQASELHAAVDPSAISEFESITTWHLAVRALIDERAGTKVISQAQIEKAIRTQARSAVGQMHQSRMAALAARRLLRSGKGRRAAKAHRQAVEQAHALGMEGVVVEALVALAALQKEIRQRGWRSTAEEALVLATELGRLADAKQLQTLLER